MRGDGRALHPARANSLLCKEQDDFLDELLAEDFTQEKLSLSHPADPRGWARLKFREGEQLVHLLLACPLLDDDRTDEGTAPALRLLHGQKIEGVQRLPRFVRVIAEHLAEACHEISALRDRPRTA